MGYGIWGYRTPAVKDQREFHEKGYKRAGLAEWDDRWQALSVDARGAFLKDVKGPVQPQRGSMSQQPSVLATKFRPEVLKELEKAGFVRVEPGTLKTRPGRVVALESLIDFARRVRALHRIRLLAPDQPGDLKSYLNVAYTTAGLVSFVAKTLENAGIEDFGVSDEQILSYLSNEDWPGWVAGSLKDPLAERVLEVVRGSSAPLPVAKLPGLVKGADPGKVRKAIDRLVAHLAVVEDLNGATFEIEVGLLPAVRARMARAAKRGGRPPLVVCESPREVGPEGGPRVDDLRAFLLEVAGEPPRVRQNGGLFSKEDDRFLHALEPLPAWLALALGETREARLEVVYHEAVKEKFVATQAQGKELRLGLTRKGQSWLSAATARQYATLYETLQALPEKGGAFDDFDFLDEYESSRYAARYYSSYRLHDESFLGSDVTVVKAKAGSNGRRTSNPKAGDVKALREAFGRALLSLPAGVFHRLDSVARHFSFGADNVLLLGQKPAGVRVVFHGQPVPAIGDERDEAGRAAVEALALERLVPLGCLQAASHGGDLYVARTHRLGAYFGLEPMPEEPGAGPSAGARVVVQPDFSVVVIGLASAPLAELAPFCDRTNRGAGPGAAVLKITRDSVVRAIAHGLKPKEILDRLNKHASPAPPANVVREIREWSGWVREVKTEPLTVIRCPDRDTADRVVSVLKGQAERLNDTTIALDGFKLTPAERKKLKDQGILLKVPAAPAAAKPPRRGRPW